jgi:hypothetical protein
MRVFFTPNARRERLCDTEGDAEAEDMASAIGSDAEGDEHRTVEHAAAVADFLLAGVEDDVEAIS